MKPILTIIVIWCLAEYLYKPRLDVTPDKKLLLWYGYGERKFVILIGDYPSK